MPLNEKAESQLIKPLAFCYLASYKVLFNDKLPAAHFIAVAVDLQRIVTGSIV